jgi:hypothetical protein
MIGLLEKGERGRKVVSIRLPLFIRTNADV